MTIKLIDSHCHLPHNETALKEWLESAAQEGVEKFITIGTSLEDNKKCIQIAEENSKVYTTTGIYPHEDLNISIGDLRHKLQKQLNSSKKIVGIGECGIDITDWHGGRDIQDQIKVFEMQIKLALENNLPLVLHNRNGDEQVIAALTKHSLLQINLHKLKGVAHCFASSWETAQKLLSLGFYISFSGLITYPSRKELLETVQKVPLDKFVLETDSPYLPPQGFRGTGKKNQPKYVRMIAQKVAEIKELPFELICSNSYQNTRKIFNLN